MTGHLVCLTLQCQLPQARPEPLSLQGPQGPPCLASTPPQRHFLDERRARAPRGRLRRKALSTCRRGPRRRRVDSLGCSLIWTRATAHSTGSRHCGNACHPARRKLLEISARHIPGSGHRACHRCAQCWGSRAERRPSEAAVCQRPGVGGHVPQPRAAASRPGRGALAAAMLTAKATARSRRGCRGPHARSGRRPDNEAPQVPIKGEPWAPVQNWDSSLTPPLGPQRQPKPCPPLTGLGNRTENQEATSRQLVKSWLYLSLIHLISVMPLGRPQ